MLKKMTWFLLTTLLVAGGCTTTHDPSFVDDPDEGEDLDTTSFEIVGGYDTSIDHHPWQVGLRMNGVFCGGSILAEDWVLTAAHCVDGSVDAEDVHVYAGITARSRMGIDGQTRDVSHIVLHPEYDVALLELAAPMDLTDPRVSTIQMATTEDALAGLIQVGVYSAVTGWGSMQTGVATETLQEVEVPIITTEAAEELYSRDLGDDQLAAGYVGVGGKDACSGDSGGPLTVPTADGSDELLAGVVSWGTGCAEPDYPGMYVRVSTFNEWARDEMGAPNQPLGNGSYCTDEIPCGAGKGDCDDDGQCMEGLECVHNVGADYGFSAVTDICTAPAPVGSNGGWTHCDQDNPCDLGEGDCDDDSECLPGLICKNNIGDDYGFSRAVDMCERPCTVGEPGTWTFCSDDCPCGIGEGDCDSDSECAAGLICWHDSGAYYGFGASVDVCEYPLH